MVCLPVQSDCYSNHDHHIHETGAHEICGQHSISFPRVLQQIVEKQFYFSSVVVPQKILTT